MVALAVAMLAKAYRAGADDLRKMPGNAVTLPDAVACLEKEAHRIIGASKRTMKDGTAAFPPQVGIGYEAFWLSDYEYTLEGAADSYSDQEVTDACRPFVRSLRADRAGVECVEFDGTPAHQPAYCGMGKHPVANGSQFTVGVARVGETGADSAGRGSRVCLESAVIHRAVIFLHFFLARF